jgi:hypothetical protein
MTQETQEKLISAATTVLLAGIGAGLYYVGAHEPALLVIGAALGHAAPRRARRAS